MNADGFGLSTDLQTQVEMIRQQLLDGIDDAFAAYAAIRDPVGACLALVSAEGGAAG